MPASGNNRRGGRRWRSRKSRRRARRHARLDSAQQGHLRHPGGGVTNAGVGAPQNVLISGLAQRAVHRRQDAGHILDGNRVDAGFQRLLVKIGGLQGWRAGLVVVEIVPRACARGAAAALKRRAILRVVHGIEDGNASCRFHRAFDEAVPPRVIGVMAITETVYRRGITAGLINF